MFLVSEKICECRIIYDKYMESLNANLDIVLAFSIQNALVDVF